MSMVRALSATLFVAALLAPSVSSAQQAIGPAALVQMRLDSNFNQCWDFAEGDTSNYVTLQVWGCQADKQQWYATPYNWTPGSSQFRYNFMSRSNGTCIAVENDSMANGARIVQRPCDYNNPSQQWVRLTRDNDLRTKSKYMNARSGKCMDAPYSSNGTHFQQWDCAKASYWAQQMFRAALIPN